jgi:hypothetical protein
LDRPAKLVASNLVGLRLASQRNRNITALEPRLSMIPQFKR